MGRREITTGITLTVLVGMLVLGAVWGWRFLFAELPGSDVTAGQPRPTCRTETVEAGQRVRSRQVRVSVYNAGTRGGLAGDTMERLRKRGFRVGDVGNAPADVDVRKVQIRSTEADDPHARLVARQFGRSARVRVVDEDLGPGVDVVVGDRFPGLVRAPRSLTTKEPREVCVPLASDEPAG